MLPHCLVRPPDEPAPGLENLDYETLNQEQLYLAYSYLFLFYHTQSLLLETISVCKLLSNFVSHAFFTLRFLGILF